VQTPTDKSEPDAGGALQGLRVVDLTRNLAGPYCTMLLADLGADVVKIEQPGAGDDTRSWAPPLWGPVSATFLAANRNKRSVAVDLDRPEGVEVVKKLALDADVVVESFRPGSLERRGLGYETLRAANPRLVYCSVSAFGQEGPLSGRPGYDPVIQAHTGILSVTGEPDGPPVRLGVAAIDLGTGLWASIGILAALASRAATGEGSRVETSLYEVATWWLSYQIAGFLGSGVVPNRQGTTAAFIAPYEVFEASDGGIMVAAANDRLFASLCDVLERPDLVTDERFLTNPLRVANRDVLRPIVAELIAKRSAAEWYELLSARSIPCSPVRTVADLMQDQQLAVLGLMAESVHPEAGPIRLVGMPVSRNGERSVREQTPPLLGQHTDEVLGEIGLDRAEIDSLRQSGVVG
jgi:crotonobetainyl-CoA:carnitine CoA-transferase CaiB-like acyl-CoA transferase